MVFSTYHDNKLLFSRDDLINLDIPVIHVIVLLFLEIKWLIV